MIKARCQTQIDAFRYVQWPKMFHMVPQIGSYVEALGPVHYENRRTHETCTVQLRLKVVSVTQGSNQYHGNEEEPWIEVELHDENAYQLGYM